MKAANENIAEDLARGELEAIEQDVRRAFAGVLRALRIDTERDHNTQDTAARVARMYVREVFAGRFEPRPRITEFPNAKNLDEVYAIGPITVRSCCSHHFVPIMGRLWVGVLPSNKVIGLSKFVRLAQWVMARPQIQEEAAVMLADELEACIKPLGLGVIMDAKHNCMTWRGVQETDTEMSTSVMRGAFLTEPALRAEFMKLIEVTRK